MAKRRKHKTTHRRRHRSIGAMGGKKTKMLVRVGSLLAGYFMADQINAFTAKVTPKTTDASVTPALTSTNTTIQTVGEVGLGALLLLKKGNNTMSLAINAAGGLLAGAGAKLALKKAGLISGYQSVPVIGRHRMAGYQSVPVIGGRMPSQLTGAVPNQLSGYRVGSYIPSGSGVGVLGSKGSGISTGSDLMG